MELLYASDWYSPDRNQKMERIERSGVDYIAEKLHRIWQIRGVEIRT